MQQMRGNTLFALKIRNQAKKVKIVKIVKVSIETICSP